MPKSRKAFPVRRLLAAGALLTAAAVARERRHPQALPYALRLFIEGPHPFITHERLHEILAPAPGDRILEVGPGTGYYSLEVARWIGSTGRLEVFDVQQTMLDHTIRAAAKQGLDNLVPTQGDARSLPFEAEGFDAVLLVGVLGEIPDQLAALGELRRVLKPGGRLVVGETVLDPHVVTFGSLRERTDAAGLRFERRTGHALGYFARFTPA
jgi:ubiquinone/menaquinone biosynthesis C-methylase UbiE